MLNWLKELLDKDCLSIKKWKMEARSKQQRLVLIWNSYEGRTYPLFLPANVDLIEHVFKQTKGKQEYFSDFFDYREQKVASGQMQNK